MWDATHRNSSDVVDEVVVLARDAAGNPLVEEHQMKNELIDDYATKWIATAEEGCAARQVGSDDGGGARRQRCLEARKAEVEQLLDALRSGATGMTQQAVPAAAECFVLGAVGTRGARDFIRTQLSAQGRVEGRDFLMVA